MRTTVRAVFLTLFFAFLSGCGNGFATLDDFPTLSSGELTVALYPEFAPVVYRDPGTEEVVGIDVDILQAFADSYGLELNILERSFDGIWELPANGEVDVAGTGISELDSRLVDGMTWSARYYTVRRSLSIRAEDSDRLKTMADFEQLAIAYTPGSTGEHDTRQRAPATTQLVPYNLEETAIKGLLSGKIDAIARGDVSSLYDAFVNPSLAVTDLHYYDPEEYFVFSIPSGNTALELALNRFLVEMDKSGSIDKIIDLYFRDEKGS